MKQFLGVLLALSMMAGLLAGCAATSGPSGIAPTNPVTLPEDSQNPQTQQTTADLVSQALGHTVSADSMVVESVEMIDGDTVVKYDQAYQGVEVVGNSVVVIAGEEMQTIGTHYDFSEAFGDDFEALVQEASRVPDWMVNEIVDGVEVTYHTDTLKPVIYMDGDTPVVALQFDVTLNEDRFTLVMDVEEQTCYQYFSDLMGFNSTQTQGGTFVAEQDGKVYAYDMEHGVYISNICVMDQEILDKYYDGTGAKVEDYLIQELTGDSGDELVLGLLDTAGDVMQWYEDQFGYRGVDGNAGEAMCIVVQENKLGSIAANACENGHVFLLAFNMQMESVAEAPEIFAHEMGHAVLKNVVKLRNTNQAGSLHEAISDVFACLYDEDGDWEVGDGLFGVSSRDIAGYNRTMDDFRYDSQYMKDFDTGEYIYLGESNLLTYIREKVVGTESCSVATYYNAAIVSGTLHKIWRDVFRKDNDAFAEVLWDSLQYLPKTADFTQFRAAFMYSAKKLLGGEIARQVGMKFDAAGIYHVPDHYAVIREQETPDYLVDMLEKTYGAVTMLTWDSCDFADMEDRWYCFCEKGYYNLSFTYEGSNVEDRDALPMSLDLFYYNVEEPVDPVPITKGLKFGMTYGEIGEKFDISPLENTEYAGSEYPVIARIETEKYSIVLTFDGVDENAVFDGVSILKK